MDAQIDGYTTSCAQLGLSPRCPCSHQIGPMGTESDNTSINHLHITDESLPNRPGAGMGSRIEIHTFMNTQNIARLRGDLTHPLCGLHRNCHGFLNGNVLSHIERIDGYTVVIVVTGKD